MSGGAPTDDGPAGATHAAPAPAPSPVDVGVVAAMPVEVGFLTDRLSKVRKYSGPRHSVIEGECAGKVVAIVVAGLGRERARGGAELLIDGHRPRWMVSAGFAGALDPDLRRYDTVMPVEVLDLHGARYAIDVGVPAEGPAARIRTGRLVTVDAIVRTAAEKAELRARTGADVVDMETCGVAALCSERGLRFLSIRVVSDDAHADLPAEIASLLTRSGSYRVGAAVRAIWHRPSSIKDFWALHEHAQEAADRLAAVVEGALGALT